MVFVQKKCIDHLMVKGWGCYRNAYLASVPYFPFLQNSRFLAGGAWPFGKKKWIQDYVSNQWDVCEESAGYQRLGTNRKRQLLPLLASFLHLALLMAIVRILFSRLD